MQRGSPELESRCWLGMQSFWRIDWEWWICLPGGSPTWLVCCCRQHMRSQSLITCTSVEDCLNIFNTWQLSSPRASDPREAKAEAPEYFIAYPQKSDNITSLISYWLHRSALINMEREYRGQVFLGSKDQGGHLGGWPAWLISPTGNSSYILLGNSEI